MNIYLIPYTGWRHLVMALVVGGAALATWWIVLWMVVAGVPFFYDTLGIIWTQAWEGPLYIGSLATGIAFTSLLAEGSLRRRRLRWRLLTTLGGASITMTGTLACYGLWQVMLPLFTGEVTDLLVADTSLVTLRFRLMLWLTAGFWSGAGPFAIRRLHAWVQRRWGWGKDTDYLAPAPTWVQWGVDLFSHVGGATVAAALGAAAWHLPGHDHRIAGDLYLASAFGAVVWGTFHGLLVWPIPDDLYVGWVRVLSSERYGLRIPVPHPDGSPSERFLGHFPRGLDLYLPVEQGVAELHTSFIVDADGHYAVRGLSVQPTEVKRFLERIDLRYDPRRPAPLETRLHMEDRIFLGENRQTVIEFIMLPKEER